MPEGDRVTPSPARSSASAPPRAWRVWVCSTTFPDTTLTAPNPQRARLSTTPHDRPLDARQGDPQERLAAVGPEAARGLFLLVTDLLQHRDTSRITSGSATKTVAITIAGVAKTTSIPASESDGPNQPVRLL